VKILHICAGWQKWNGAANIARMIMDEQRREGHEVSFATWAKVRELRVADEVWIHCGWLPCLWWAALWGRNVHWMPEACYDPIRRAYHGWKKTLVGPIERFCLRRAKALVATCEAEKDWIESYLGRRCPPIALTDIKRFFKLHGEVSTRNRPLRVDATPGEAAKPSESSAERREDAEFSLGRCPRPPSAEGSPISLSAHSAPLRLCVKNNEQAEPLHLLYLGRRHPLKGLSYLEAALTTYYNMWSKSSASPTPTNACTAHPSGNPSIKPSNTTYYNKCPIDFRVVSSAFGDELEKVWDWCDVLVLPTLSENFGLVIAEALERGKSVITTDGAPAWECECKVEKCKVGSAGAIWQGYDGRLIYLKGYRTGTPEDRIRLLQSAIENLLCPASLTPPASHASLTSPAVK